MTPRRLFAALVVSAAVLSGCGAAPEPPDRAGQAHAPVSSPAPSVAAPIRALPTGLSPPRLQLPADVTPLAYLLDLTVFPDRESFSGRVRINIRFDRATDGFWIHGRGLEVDKVRLHAGGSSIDATYAQVTGDGVVRIGLASRIAPQIAQLDISYHGTFSRLLEGVFRVEVEGLWYAFTQFEPIDARGAFPGFDQPRFKTPFTLSIVVPKTATVAANSKVAEIDSLPDGSKRVLFEPSPPLPTYLVAFAVGPLDIADGGNLEGDPSHQVPLRGLAARGRGPEFSYALENTPEIVALLEDYFAQPYPFAKLDLVAVPTQQGAMENAGLITYGEYAMLFGEKPPLNQQRAFASVHAHELAHQWFGNSVTMPWWDDLWLNEAFATFMSYKTVQAWRPSYRASDALIQSSLAAMDADALAKARRIREPIESVDDITNAFDGITYSKGAGVLNMLEGFLGESVFRDGVRVHLRRHAGGSADMHDLVASLAEVSGHVEIAGIVKSFTDQSGTPLIDIRIDCGTQRPTMTLTQQRYLPVGSTADAQRQWDVPVCVRFGAVDAIHEQCVVLTQPSMEFALDGIDGCPNWLMPNRGGRGYYRWRLDDTRLGRLTAVMYSALEPGERLSVADGLVAGVVAGGANLAAFFDRLPQLLKSHERFLLMSPVPLWRAIQTHMLDEAGRSSSRIRMRALYGPVLAELRKRGVVSDEDRLTQMALVNVLAIDGRDTTLRAELTRGAIDYLGFGGDGQLHRDKLDVNLVTTALRVAAQDAAPQFAVDLVGRLPELDDPVLRYAFLSAIGVAGDPTLAQRLAQDESIRGDDLLNLVDSMFTAEQAERSWLWLSANIDALIGRTPTFERDLLIQVTGRYCTAERADAVAALFEPRLRLIDGGRRVLDQTLERIGLCVALRNAYEHQARELFN